MKNYIILNKVFAFDCVGEEHLVAIPIEVDNNHNIKNLAEVLALKAATELPSDFSVQCVQYPDDAKVVKLSAASFYNNNVHAIQRDTEGVYFHCILRDKLGDFVSFNKPYISGNANAILSDFAEYAKISNIHDNDFNQLFRKLKYAVREV